MGELMGLPVEGQRELAERVSCRRRACFIHNERSIMKKRFALRLARRIFSATLVRRGADGHVLTPGERATLHGFSRPPRDWPWSARR